MTHNDYTKNLLNIKDKNINLYENYLESKKIKGIETKIIRAFLTYDANICPICKHHDCIIKWNWKRNCKIKIPKISNYNAIILLDKQRFKCKHYNRTFIATSSLVDKFCNISNNTKLSIKSNLMDKISEKDIAKRNNVSPNHVNRILDTISQDKLIKNYGKFPEKIGIDEFNATKDTKSKMAFIIVNQDSRNIFDINNSRLSYDIEKYFKRYSKQERDKVKLITMDLYKPYYKIMHNLFKNAILISDRFHIVIQPRNALDNTRKRLCNKSNPNYKKMKKYWKLILKKENELDDKKKRYNKHFRKELTQKEIVTYLINTDKTLYNEYQIYQGLDKAINNRDKELFYKIVNNNKNNKYISKDMKKVLKTFKNMEKYIKNSFDYKYSNGIVEGINNVIKQIKHTACGYKKFTHLKARVMLVKGLYNPIKA